MHKTTLSESTKTIRSYNPTRVRDLIIELVDTLDVSHLVIFIDEWITLQDCQVAFAERLRKTLLHERRIALKIAADQYQAEFNNSGEGGNFRGLDIGRDIFVGLDLDEPFHSPSDVDSFFAEALYKRLKVFNPDIGMSFGPPPLPNAPAFVESIFSNSNAFHHACRAAHGICRDFYEIVRQSYKKAGSSVSSQRRITLHDVRAALGDMTAPLYDRINRSPSGNALLRKAIAPHIRLTQSRYFATLAQPGKRQAVLNSLVSRRVIHKTRPELLHPTLQGQFDVYEINAGLFSNLMHAVEFNTGVRVDDTFRDDELQGITESTIASYLLDERALEAAEGTTLLVCPHCDHEFLSTEKAYVARNICPICFQDQPEGDEDD